MGERTGDPGDEPAGRRALDADPESGTPTSEPAAPVPSTIDDTIFVRPPGWRVWAAPAALALPLGILLHELGHYAAGLAFDFPGLRLTATAVQDRADQEGYPAWQRGIQSAAGPLVTWAIVGVCCLLARRGRLAPAATAAGLATVWRPVLMVAGFLMLLAMGRDLARANVDEIKAAVLLGLPPAAVMGVETLLTAGAATYLLRRLPHGRKRRTAAIVASGGLAGLVVYIALMGALLG